MSQTRKEIIAALDAEAAARKQESDAHAGALAALNAEVEAQKTRADAAEAALKAEVDAHAATKAAIEAKAVADAEAVTKATAALAAETEAHAATEKLLTIAKDALANPAQVDAAMTAINGGVSLQAARDAEADAAEAAALKPETVSVLKTWQEITEPKARREFYLANKEAIKAEIKGGK